MKKIIRIIGLFIGIYFTINSLAYGIPNPASVNCEEKGGKLEIRKDQNGGEYGVCKFANGKECEEWAFYRGECKIDGIVTTGNKFTSSPANSTIIGMPNPASKNCIDKGGELKIEKIGNKNEIGVCYFEDGKKCEEWALFNGKCPVGGIKVTGYITPESQYCAIMGGDYDITAGSGTPQEDGTCTLDNKKIKVKELYNGTVENVNKDINKDNKGNIATGNMMAGSDKDEHGCIATAGYLWDEKTQQCARPWENQDTANICQLTDKEKSAIDNLFENLKNNLAKKTKEVQIKKVVLVNEKLQSIITDLQTKFDNKSQKLTCQLQYLLDLFKKLGEELNK